MIGENYKAKAAVLLDELRRAGKLDAENMQTALMAGSVPVRDLASPDSPGLPGMLAKIEANGKGFEARAIDWQSVCEFLKRTLDVGAERQKLLEHYARKDPQSFLQFDGWCNQGTGDDFATPDAEGDWLCVGKVRELMSGGPSVRVLVTRRTSKEDTLRLLRKLADMVSEDRWDFDWIGSDNSPEAPKPNAGVWADLQKA